MAIKKTDETKEVDREEAAKVKRLIGQVSEAVKETHKYTALGISVGSLVDEKNKAYGNSFANASKFLQILYPNGIPIEAYTDVLCIVRIFDKLMRIANNKDYNGESPYGDLAGYALLGLQKDKDEKVIHEMLTEKPKMVKKERTLINEEADFASTRNKYASDFQGDRTENELEIARIAFYNSKAETEDLRRFVRKLEESQECMKVVKEENVDRPYPYDEDKQAATEQLQTPWKVCASRIRSYP